MTRIEKVIFGLVVLCPFIGLDRAFGQALDPPTNADLQGKLAEITEALAGTQSGFSTISKNINAINARVQALTDDLIRIEGGGTIVKKGVSGAALIKDDLKNLQDVLTKAEAERVKTIAELDGIYAEIAEIRCQLVGGKRVNDLHGFLRANIATLTKSLAEADIAGVETTMAATDPKSLRQELEKFYPALSKFNIAVNAGTSGFDVVARMAELTTALKILTPKQFGDMPGSTAAVAALATRLRLVSDAFTAAEVKLTVDEIGKAAVSLTNALTKKETAAALVQGLKKDLSASDSLMVLKSAVENLGLVDAGLVVRVAEAKFGDTYPKQTYIPQRWCDATAFMRATCDKEKSCDIPDDYEIKVCGFNPAPAADPRHRGLFVLYECVRNIESNFAGRYGPEGFQTEAGKLQKASDSYVVVRGGGKLLCAR